MVIPDDQNSDFVVNAAEQKVIREPRKFALQPRKIAAQQIRLGAADKPTAKRQVVDNFCLDGFDSRNGGKQISAGQVRRLERELKKGDGLSNKQWVQTVKNCF